jgi:hypothetical protein
MRRVHIRRSRAHFCANSAEAHSARRSRVSTEEQGFLKNVPRYARVEEKFLIFHLNRPDVLPVGDLGIRNAARTVYGLEALPTPAELEEIADSWRPHRSLGALYLWRSLDNEPA